MKKARYTSVLVIIILIIALMQWPIGLAIVPQDQTISIVETHDDAFITESGNWVDSQLCAILDPGMDIRSYLVFRDVKVNNWEPLTNATLRFRTTANLDFEADSKVTIYGMRYSELQKISIIRSDFVLSVPLTSAYMNMNTSQFYGQQWHEVNVTSIVEELIRSHAWDGDGHDGTETGDAIGFVIFGDEGYKTRWFIDYLYGTPSLAPQLVIHWNHEPPPPPDMPEGAKYNETLGNYTIWSLDPDLDENRTGQGADVNWNILNMTELTEQDSGSDIVLNNDTWATVTTMLRQETASLYNDTGSLNVDSYFLRFKVNMTDVLNTEADIQQIPSFYGLSTLEPSTSAGLAYGDTGDWVGLICIVAIDDVSWGVWAMERDGLTDELGPGTGYIFKDTSKIMTYWEVFVNWTNTPPYIRYNFYNDAAFSDLNKTGTKIINYADGPFRYPQTLASMGQAGASHDSFEYYTFNESQVSLGEPTWYVHETAICTVTGPFDTYNGSRVWIDTEDPDPEDPDPPGWPETGYFTRFSTRLYFLILGFGCLFGPILFFAWKRPSGYYILCGAIVMLIGIGMLISIGQV